MAATSAVTSQQTLVDETVRYVVDKYGPKGTQVGWLMIASILIEACLFR